MLPLENLKKELLEKERIVPKTRDDTLLELESFAQVHEVYKTLSGMRGQIQAMSDGFLKQYDNCKESIESVLAKTAVLDEAKQKIGTTILDVIYPMQLVTPPGTNYNQSQWKKSILKNVFSDPSQDFIWLHPERIIRDVWLYVWDVDGHWTKGDRVPDESKRILAQEIADGSLIAFPSGRDTKWLIDKMKWMLEIPNAINRVLLMPELGLYSCRLDGSNLQEADFLSQHRLVDPIVRAELGKLAYQVQNLKLYSANESVMRGYKIYGDAENNLYHIPDIPNVAVPIAISSPTKNAIFTYELFRDMTFKIALFASKKRAIFEAALEAILDELGYSQDMGLSLAGTAIDIAPKINGELIDKRHACGQAIAWASSLLGDADLETVAAHTIAGGDGDADRRFARPIYKNWKGRVSWIHSGNEASFLPDEDFLECLAISSAVTKPDGKMGPEVTAQIAQAFLK